MNFVGIDPATNTGFVRIDLQGNVLIEKRISPIPVVKGAITIDQLISLKKQVRSQLKKDDHVMLESGATKTFRAYTTGMIHGTLRIEVVEKIGSFEEVNPSQLKKYVGVKDTRMVAKNKRKELVYEAVKDMYGYTHEHHDVIDAFVIAIISRDYYLYTQGERNFLKQQLEVLESIYAKKHGIQLKEKKPAKPKPKKGAVKNDNKS